MKKTQITQMIQNHLKKILMTQLKMLKKTFSAATDKAKQSLQNLKILL